MQKWASPTMQGRPTVKSSDATHIRFRLMNNGPVRAVSLVVPSASRPRGKEKMHDEA
jgi:hypothetical protein